MHFGDEEIQRLLHGEIDGALRSQVLEHVEACLPCRQRVEEARRDEAEIYALMGHADHPTPEVHPQSLIGTRSRAPAADWKRKAALITLVVGGAGVAYATPGSPLPGWIRSLGAVLSRAPSASTTPSTATPSESAPMGGIAVTPRARFTIRFASAQASGIATVTLTDGPDIVARSVNGTATFMTDVDRLTISNARSTADYEIQIPRSATWVEIRVATRRLLLKRGTEVQSDLRADSLGRYMLPLTP